MAVVAGNNRYQENTSAAATAGTDKGTPARVWHSQQTGIGRAMSTGRVVGPRVCVCE